MQGRQDYQPKLFSTVNLETLIPKDHLLRRVDKALDLSFIRDLTANLYCANNGRPSIDPELFFRIVLIEYFYDVNSDRQVCEEIGYNLAYRWYCRLSLEDSVPHHSSMTRIRDRLGEETFRKVFLQVIELCRKAGLVKAEKVMTDGTWLEANASLNSLIEQREDGGPDDSGKARNTALFKLMKINSISMTTIGGKLLYFHAEGFLYMIESSHAGFPLDIRASSNAWINNNPAFAINRGVHLVSKLLGFTNFSRQRRIGV